MFRNGKCHPESRKMPAGNSANPHKCRKLQCPQGFDSLIPCSGSAGNAVVMRVSGFYLYKKRLKVSPGATKNAAAEILIVHSNFFFHRHQTAW